MESTLPAIAVAHRGRTAMLRAIFGSDDGPETGGPPKRGKPTKPLTPAMFDAMFAKMPRGKAN